VYVYFRRCLERYKTILSVVDTDEMWNKYLTTMINIISGARSNEIYKIFLIKNRLHNAHKKNKLKPNHYFQLVRALNYVLLDTTLNFYYCHFHLCCLDK